MKTIRNLCLCAATLASVIVTTISPAYASSGTISGTVTLIKVQDTAVGNTFFEINNPGTVGNCYRDGGGTSGPALILIPDNDRGKQMMAVAQAALLAGKSVVVALDDGNSSSGTYCFAQYVVLTP